MNGRWMMTFVVLGVVLPAAAQHASAAPLRSFTVEQFNESYKKWVGRDVRVSGRRSSFGPHQIRLLKCDVPFRSKFRLKKPQKDFTNVQIDGRVMRRGRNYFVQIRGFHVIKSDEQQFESRKSRMNRNSAAEWYDLAKWAEQLGRFYDDAKLLELSREANERGIDAGRRAARGKDATALKKLAVTAKDFDLPESLQLSLLHEAYVLMRQQAKNQGDFERAISGVSRDLPGCETPLQKFNTDLRKQYESDPLATYEQTSSGRRKLLHRMLMAELVLASLQSELDKNFANGFEIANNIEQEIPEYRDLAQQYRKQALAARTREVATLSKSEILALKQDYESQQQPKKGAEVFEAWLEVRLRRLDSDDITGLINVADEFADRLDRPDRAAKLLIKADRRNADDPQIAAKLEQLGYRKKRGKWVSEMADEEEEKSEIELAMQKGLLIKGMTAVQVRKTLGVPLKRLRMASQGAISEVWTYETSPITRMVVFLRRQSNNRESRVVEFGEVKAARSAEPAF